MWPQYLMVISGIGFFVGLIAFLQINVAPLVPESASTPDRTKQVPQEATPSLVWDQHLGHTYSGQGASMITEAFQIGVRNDLGHEIRLERVYAVSGQGYGEKDLEVAADVGWVSADKTLTIANGRRIALRITFGQMLSREVFEQWKIFQISLRHDGQVDRFTVTEPMVRAVYASFAPNPIGPMVRTK